LLTVLPTLHARAQKGGGLARVRVKQLDLVVVRVGYVDVAVGVGHGLRVLQQHLCTDTIGITEVEQTCAHERAQAASLCRLNAPNSAGLTVSYEQRVTVGGQAAGLVKAALQRRSVAQLLAAAA